MTERGKAAVARDATTFTIGPSALSWEGGVLTVRFEETAVPSLGQIRGTVRVIPTALTRIELELDDEGRHFWRPLAPCARVEVKIDKPGLQWSGDGYIDANRGDVPLEDTFVRWDWSRARLKDGAAVVYQGTRRRDGDFSVGLRFDQSGGVVEFEPPPRTILPPTFWRIPRYVSSEAAPKVIETLEDAPFYARSLVETRLLDQPVTIFHESLSLDRFRMPVVQMMLPFRMPRRAG